ncbi:MAG TPA: TetR/AcrR family transcriptional regulator [Acidimicrobiales bacterium]
MAGRRSDADARDTRAAILRRAADVGSVDGLEGVTLGRLAADLGMSKAGVIGQFGSKEALQLETVKVASDIFLSAVWEPAKSATPGLPRLLAVCASWTAYADDPPFSGGCFLATTSVEFASRSGLVHDALSKALQLWHRTLTKDVVTAVEAGDMPKNTDPERVVFALEALAAGVKPAKLLQNNLNAAGMALQAMQAVLCGPLEGNPAQSG